MPEGRRELIKLCGMNRPEHIVAANEVQPDYVGIVVDYPQSPRSVTIPQAATLASASRIPVVAVTVEPSQEQIDFVADAVRPHAVQLSGGESPERVGLLVSSHAIVEFWKVLHLSPEPSPDEIARLVDMAQQYAFAGVARLMVDAAGGAMPGGTGRTISWEAVAEFARSAPLPVMLAGGLTPANVAEAISLAQPAGVDVSGGIESAPGVKDPRLLHAFVEAARRGFDRLQAREDNGA
jgi:phosphoribosylanthranilate isomerase